MIHGEEVMNVARESIGIPKSAVYIIDEVEQFEPFWRVGKSFGTNIRSLVVCMGMPHLTYVQLLRALRYERRVHSVCARQVH